MTKKQLLQQQRSIRKQLDELDNKQWVKENKRLVGTYWKFKNCYSCPENERDYWWAYRKLVSIDLRGGHFLALTFQVDKHGWIRVETDEYCSGPNSWTECTEDEFKTALDALKGKVATL